MNNEEHPLELYDPVQIEIDHIGQLGAGDIEPDFNNPQIARYLAQQLIVRLHELRRASHDKEVLLEKQEKIQAEISDLKVENGILSESN